MEQQPGPVNWAPYNPAPLPGMVRLWSWEAFAHGAEVVSYFRWRQAPFAQEQMHAGLLRPDGAETDALDELRKVFTELSEASEVNPFKAPVALVFDYDADFAWTTQPHGKSLSYFQLVFDTYRALRSLGMSIDIIPNSTRDFEGYRLVLAPGLMHMSDELKSALTQCNAITLLGPRSGSRTEEMQIPIPLPPSITGLDLVVEKVESLRPDMPIPLETGGHAIGYREFIETGETVFENTSDGAPILIGTDKLRYLAGILDQSALRRIFHSLLLEVKLEPLNLPDGVRVRETGSEIFWFNYDNDTHFIAGIKLDPVSYMRQQKQT
ncbi:MAG: beta-galactosidase, partial [Pseudomonadota bacterium]